VTTSGRFEGTWFVVPTPFSEDGSVDLASQGRLVNAAIDWGVDGLTAMGVTSEASFLRGDERSAALGVVAEAIARRVPLIVGCSAPTEQEVVARIAEARRYGAAGVMVAAPEGAGATDLPAFFEACAGGGGLPLVIQDEPAATGVNMPAPVLTACLRAARAMTVKLEAPPTAPKIAALHEDDPGLRVFGGLGGAYALAELRAGACGTMTGFAFPEIMAAIRRGLHRADPQAAGRVYDAYLPLIQFEAQPVMGLAVRKELLRRRGVIATGRCRKEPNAIDEVTTRELDDVLARADVRPDREMLRVP
jgi:4-hydroxy-tetrahydrodipicolinate synthase